VRHRLGLATRTQISVCKSPFPSAGTALSLFRAKTVHVALTQRQSLSGNIAVCHLQNVATHHCADVLFKAKCRQKHRKYDNGICYSTSLRSEEPYYGLNVSSLCVVLLHEVEIILMPWETDEVLSGHDHAILRYAKLVHLRSGLRPIIGCRILRTVKPKMSYDVIMTLFRYKAVC